MNILIIGGTGFLGSHIVKKLITKKYNIYILSRDISKIFSFDKEKVNLICGNIIDLNFIIHLPEKIDFIIYTAMPPLKVGRVSKEQFKRIKETSNIYLKNTVELAKKFDSILIITSGASFSTKNSEVADESWSITRKGMASIGEYYDKMILEIKKENSIQLIEMLPGQIYGNGGLFKKIISMANSGKIIIFGDGKNYLPRIHVEDCAEAYILAIDKQPIGKRFILCDDKPCSVSEFMNYLAKIYNVKNIKYIPKFLLRIILGKYIYETFTMNTIVTNDYIKKELDWKLKYPTYKEGLDSLLD